MEPLLAAALAGLAVLGAGNALFFTLAAWGRVRPDAPWLPRACRLDEGTCQLVLRHREARLLGVPNSVLGLGYYVLVLSASLAGLATGSLPACALLLAAGLAAVAMSAYLAWALLRKLRARCVLCFLGHGVNAALLAGLAFACA